LHFFTAFVAFQVEGESHSIRLEGDDFMKPATTFRNRLNTVLLSGTCSLLMGLLVPGWAAELDRQPKSHVDAAKARGYAEELRLKTQSTSLPAATVASHGKELSATEEQATIKALKLTQKEITDLKSPWETFAAALVSQIQGAAEWKGIQIVTLPLDASWNDKKYGDYRAWRVIGDSLPTWGPSYRATSATVSGGYRVFLDNLNITPPNPDLAKKADKARKAYNDALDEVSRMQQKVGDDWADFDARQAPLPADRRLSFDEWYAQFDGARIAALQDKVNGAAQNYFSLVNQAGGGFGFAANLLIDYNNPAFQALATSPDGKKNFYRTYNVTPDLSDFIANAKSLAPGAPPRLTISFKHGSGQQHIEDTAWSGGASYGFGFFSFGVNASGGTHAVDTSASDFSMDFTARDFTVFTVTPGNWFNGTAVKALQNGPFLPNGPVASGLIPVWGPKGVLNLMVGQIVVAYKPKVKGTISQSDYSEVKTRFQSSGGFSIGPFGFGASYSRNTSDVHFDDATRTFTAEDTSDVPQIVAVVCAVLPDSM
jgi:hypothetical protein